MLKIITLCCAVLISSNLRSAPSITNPDPETAPDLPPSFFSGDLVPDEGGRILNSSPPKGDSATYQLQVWKQKKHREVSIKASKRITIWMGSKKVRGKIQRLTPEHLYIKGKAYPIEDITAIKLHPWSTKALGAVIGIAGANGTMMGISLTALANSYPIEGAPQESFFAAGAMMAIVGGTILATSFYLLDGIKYDLKKSWSLRIIPLAS